MVPGKTINKELIILKHMKVLKEISQNHVWKHWMKIEKHSNPDFRSDIRDPLPDLIWYLAEIEMGDLDKLFIISSSDWNDISGGSFKVINVVNRLNENFTEEESIEKIKDIDCKKKFLNSGGLLDTKLIAVTDSLGLDNKITFIEGNKRSVLLCELNKMIGNRIFVGVSQRVIDYHWTRYTYRTSKKGIN